MRTAQSMWLMGMVLISALEAPSVRAGDDGTKVIRSIQSRGGRVVLDEGAKGKPVVEIYLNRNAFGDADLALLKRFTSLRTLNLQVSQVTDAGLKELVGLASLESLDLHQTKVTHAGLKHLKSLKSLRTLGWTAEQVTDESVRELRALGLLHTLGGASAKGGERPASPADVLMFQLWSTRLTGEGLKELAVCKNLQSIYLNGSMSLTPAGLKELAAFKSLVVITPPRVTDETLRALREIGLLHVLSSAGGKNAARPASATEVLHLRIADPQVTAAGIKELTGFTNLERLDLSDSSLDDSALKEVAGLRSLRTLLLGKKVTDASLRELAALPSLCTLSLYGSRVTDAGLKDLARVTSLQDLDLRATKVTPRGLQALAGLKLHTLHLDNAKVTDTTLRVLREADLLHALAQTEGDAATRPTSAGAVHWINLKGTRVTDAGLRELTDLKSLKGIELARTKVTDRGIAELKKALPAAEISR